MQSACYLLGGRLEKVLANLLVTKIYITANSRLPALSTEIIFSINCSCFGVSVHFAFYALFTSFDLRWELKYSRREKVHKENIIMDEKTEKSTFLQQVINQFRVRHYSRRTEETYLYWIKRYIFFT